MTYDTLLTGLKSQLESKATGHTVLKATPYKRAGTTAYYYIYPNLYNSTPIRLRRVNKTFTVNIAVERTCTSETDYATLWGNAETVYSMFEILDDYITVNSVCFMVKSISARYFKDEGDMAYVIITISLEQLSDE